MSSIHNISKEQLTAKIQEKLGEPNASDYKGRVYVKLNDDGSFDVEFSKKNLKSQSNYVKVPNRLTRDCFAKIISDNEIQIDSAKITKWLKSLSPRLLSLFPKVHGKGEEDFRKAVLKEDLKNIENERNISLSKDKNFIQDLDELRIAFSESVKWINYGESDKEDVARFLVYVFGYDSSYKLSFNQAIQRIIVSDYKNESDFELKNPGYNALQNEYNKMLDDEESYSSSTDYSSYTDEDSDEDADEVSNKQISNMKIIENNLDTDKGLQLILSLLGVNLPIS